MKTNYSFIIYTFFSLLCFKDLKAQSCDCPPENTITRLFNTVDMTNSTSFIVPDHVTSISIKAVGADGGENDDMTGGGTGACMTGTFSVNPGDELLIVVGQHGTGFHDVGMDFNGDDNAGGGGGSAVINLSTSPNPTLLLVAGGGGGAGAQFTSEFAGGKGVATDNTDINTGAGGAGDAGIGGSGGGGGGGFMEDGMDSNDADGGKRGTLSGGGLGGAIDHSGGFGFGGGGGGSNESAPRGGGGGGFIGGDANNGGTSYRDAGGNLLANVDGIDGGTNDNPQDGSVQICWAPPNIPTISQWGIILLGLCLCIFGWVGVRQTRGAVN